MRKPWMRGTPPQKARSRSATGLWVYIGFCLMLGMCLEVAAQSLTPRFPSAIESLSPGTSATLLPDGQWLVLGGPGVAGPVPTAQRYDPAQDTFYTLSTGLRQARAYHTATLLADGQVLILGGTGPDGLPVARAELFNPEKATFQALNTPGLMARSRHGATLLVDGRLLITGGQDAQGAALADAELWNPFSQQVERFNARLDTARLRHLTALLPDHNVLIWGGVDSKGIPIRGAELYDPQTQQFVPYDAGAARQALAELDSPEPPRVVDSTPTNGATDVRVDQLLSVRFSKPLAVTSLNPDTVVLIGPDGQVSTRVTPTQGGLAVFILPAQELFPSAAYTLFVQQALDGRQQALPDVTISFRTQALGPQAGHDPGTMPAPAPGASFSSPAVGLQARPGQPASGLPGGVVTNGMPTSTQGAGTGALGSTDGMQESEAQAALPDDEAWIPGPEHRKGQWRSGRIFAHSRDTLRQRREFQHLFEGMSPRARDVVHTHMEKTGELHARLAYAPLPGVTSASHLALDAQHHAISGQVLRLNGQPLANVTLSMAGQQTRTNDQGEFLLTGVPLGEQILVIDGRSVALKGKRYGRFEYRMEVKDGVNALDFTIWMPVLDTQHAVRLPSPTTKEVVVTNPHLPGFALHIPPGTVIRDAEGKVVTEVSITPIPGDQLPFPMPYTDVPLFYTIQPGGAILQAVTGQTAGARLVYPNYSTQPRGARFPLFDYDPRGRGWYIYTTGTVSVDAKAIVPEQAFTIYQFTVSSVGGTPGGIPPTDGPKPDPCGQTCCYGDPVSCADGLFLEMNTDFHLADIWPLRLTRTYRQNDPNQRSYGVGTNHDLDMFLTFVNLSGYNADAIELILAHGGRVRFEPTGLSHSLTSAIFESKLPGDFYKAQVRLVSDSFGNAFWVTLKDGRRFVFTQHQSRLQWMEDRYGNRITVLRDNSNRIARLVSPQGRYITLAYQQDSCSGCITAATDNMGRAVKYDYDTEGRLTKVTDPHGGLTAYTYDAAHRMLTVTDPRFNRKVLNEYDANGRVKKQTYADNTTNTFAYTLNAAQKVIQTNVTHERGDVRRITYNANGYPLTHTSALGKPEQQTITYVRNADNLVTKMTDPLGRVTTYEYDTRGNVTKVTRLFGTAQATSWTYAYEPVYNQLRSATDPLNRTTTMVYDLQGNLRQITDPLANKVTFTHDALGRRLTASQYVGTTPLTTTFTYDGPDLVQVKDPLNRVVTLTPDLVGRLLSVRDPLGRLSRFTYDTLDRVTAQSDPQGSTVRMAYDGNGNLLSFTDPLNHVTQFTYDARNRLISKTDALSKTESYRYDPAGNLLFFIDRKGQVSGFDYDALQRRLKSSYGATSTTTPVYTSSTTYVYDAGNRLTTVQDSLAGTIARTYDPRFDSLTQEVTPEGTVNYTYYANGLRQTMTPSGGTAISYDYDPANRLSKITQAAGLGGGAIPGTPQIVTMGYDTANRPTSLTLPNGIQITYGYDAASQLTGITYKKADATLIGDLIYTYDAAGQRVSIGGSLSRSGLPQPLGAVQYDANNRLTKRDAVTYTYDNNGNLLSDGVNTYAWNARDQLVAVSGANPMAYAYDGLGRRRSKGTVGTLYDGWNPIQLKTGATVVENRLTGLGLDAYYARARGGAVQSYVTDALGSTLALHDAEQNAVASYSYDPYGSTSGPVDSNVVKYTGREQDFGDLYYYRNRYYKPSIGRFISEDPIGLGGGGNLYTYVYNNPLMYTDPSGLAPPHDIPPGVDVEQNIAEAKKMSYIQWYNAVKNGGKWDYKQKGSQYQDFGNYNYGVTARAVGIPSDIPNRGAGWAQEQAGTSLPQWGKWWDWSSSTSFGDDPEDQRWINEGIKDYKNGYYDHNLCK